MKTALLVLLIYIAEMVCLISPVALQCWLVSISCCWLQWERPGTWPLPHTLCYGGTGHSLPAAGKTKRCQTVPSSCQVRHCHFCICHLSALPFFFLISFSFFSLHLGTVGAQIEVPSVEKPEVLKVPAIKSVVMWFYMFCPLTEILHFYFRFPASFSFFSFSSLVIFKHNRTYIMNSESDFYF